MNAPCKKFAAVSADSLAARPHRAQPAQKPLP